jgi:hypothetical protein
MIAVDESPASSAPDQVAIPDDNDAPGDGSLGRFLVAGLLHFGCGVCNDDKSPADLGLVHGNPC